MDLRHLPRGETHIRVPHDLHVMIMCHTNQVLYLFAAFVEAPGWEFSVKQNGSAGQGSRYEDRHLDCFPGRSPVYNIHTCRGMPLFLGQLQTRPPNQYSAILTYRPERPSARADAILALNLSGTVPLMCFLAEGRILALTGYHVRNKGG